MAYNTGYIAEQDVSLGHEHIQQKIRIVKENPFVDRGTDVRSHSKRPHTVSPPLFGSQDPAPTYRSGTVVQPWVRRQRSSLFQLAVPL